MPRYKNPQNRADVPTHQELPTHKNRMPKWQRLVLYYLGYVAMCFGGGALMWFAAKSAVDKITEKPTPIKKQMREAQREQRRSQELIDKARSTP